MNAVQLLAAVRDLYERLPETRRQTPFELSCYLWSLGYADTLLDEEEIARADETARQAYYRRAVCPAYFAAPTAPSA